MKKMSKKWLIFSMIFMLIVSGISAVQIFASDDESNAEATEEVVPAEDTIEDIVAGNTYSIDTMWLLIAAFLVFLMQPGFAMLEAGLVRAKNATNIVMKNFLDFVVASIFFFLIGYGLMYGGGTSLFEGNGFIGWGNWGLSGLNASTTEIHGSYPTWADWFFQAVFCGTAATIVSGGVAERMKFPAYIIISIIISAIVYPIIGHWQWGGGWLSERGFVDFAGSTIVHATGGWAAFVGALILGPRIGKYTPDGKPRVIAGHNIPLAGLGVFLLWFGWFGFNAGSQLAASGPGNADMISLITMNTTLAAAAGALGAMVTVWILYGKPDLSMTMNGVLGGLVGITAGCASVDPWAAIVIGLIAGVIVVFGVKLLDKVKVDDPVGAVSVHGINGIWGTIAVGLFAVPAYGNGEGLFYGAGFHQLGVQLLGTFVSSAFVIVVMGIVFLILKATMGIRASREEELKGLDIGEHGMESYADFQQFLTK